MKELQIIDYIQGKVAVEQKGKWSSFYRFYPSQMKAYQHGITYRMCAVCDAGICIALKTDADYIAFDCKLGQMNIGIKSLFEKANFYQVKKHKNNKYIKYRPDEHANQYGTEEPYGACFDLLVNGVRTTSVPWKRGRIAFTIPNPHNEVQEIRIYFPYLRTSAVKNLHIDGTVALPLKMCGRILFLGDSITQGANCVHTSETWTALIARSYQYEMLNQGICGYVFHDESLAGLENEDLLLKKIVVAYGTNDWCMAASSEEMLLKMERFFSVLNGIYPNVGVYVITPMSRMDEMVADGCMSLADWRACIRKEIVKYPQMRVIEGTELLPEDSSYFKDGVLHPNDTGAKLIAEKFLSRIEQ